MSVALCTYNGERFLHEQLASIAGQSCLPDELVVCDDGSTDGSLKQMEAFAAVAPFSVRIETNPTRLGSTGNFARAISLCRGDAIALADQDDVWHPTKLTRLGQMLDDNPSVGLVFSNATMVDEQLRPLGHTLWDAIQFRPAERRRFRAGQAFDCLLRRSRVTGATLAFRSRFRDLILPIPTEWFHDGWIALLAAGIADCLPIEEPLIQYRQHPGQQQGERLRGLGTQYLVARRMEPAAFDAIAGQFAQALERLRGQPAFPSEKEQKLAEKVRHWQARASMRQSGNWRLPIIAREWWKGNYSRYSRGWKALAQDVFLATGQR